MILRECIRHECLAKVVLESSDFWRFFQLVELSTFDIASDAFANFRVGAHIMPSFGSKLRKRFRNS